MGTNRTGSDVTSVRGTIFGDCVVCYKCKKLRHISTNSLVKGKFCFTCGEEENIKVECPNDENPNPRILPAKPKGRSHKMILDEMDVVAGNLD